MKGEPVGNSVTDYPCPVPDFGIRKIALRTGEKLESKATSLEIWVIMKGATTFENSKTNVTAQKGQAAAILPNEPFTVTAQQETIMYAAFVPEAE
jgi:mannose-6-phosphate isomerase